MLASEISRSLQLDDILQAQGSACLADFADTLQKSPQCTVETFLESRPPDDRSVLAALIAIELRHRFAMGQTCCIEDYLKRFPELVKDGETILDLIYAEYCERRQHDPSAEVQDYYRRFPSYQNSLERLFHIDSLLQDELLAGDLANGEAAPLPESGDSFLEFRLTAELGRGASGRVFLAEQETLSNRHVVLKVTPRETIEHRTLARLDHPNIVPILSVHHDESSGLHAVCMPYQCAVALSDIKPTWAGSRPYPDNSIEYLDALVSSIPADRRTPDTVRHDHAEFPRGKPFVYACAWIMQRIADALHHAHMRHVCHRDLKPSNILLTVSGQPLLVDFNLSFNEAESGGDFKAFFGGTLPYIPPEQIRALHPIEQGRAEDVGPAADIYSLAATMFEIITGRPPFGVPKSGTDVLTALRSQLEIRSTIPSLRDYNPNVPVDLDALFRKCLQPEAHQRYESAAQLAEDLERFSRDQGLQYVSHSSLSLKIAKFVRRRKRGLATAVAMATVTAMLSTYVYFERVARGRAELRTVQLESDAQSEAKQALENIPADPYQYFLLGRDFFNARRYIQAEICFSKSIEMRNDYSPAYYYRGRCFANLDQDDAALIDYTRAIDLTPSDVYSVLIRALCYASSKTHADPQLALVDLERVQSLLSTLDDESRKMIYVDMSRAYSSLSSSLPSIERQNAIEQAEDYLLGALKLGVGITYLTEVKNRDRYRMLDAVFNRPKVQLEIARLSIEPIDSTSQ